MTDIKETPAAAEAEELIPVETPPEGAPAAEADTPEEDDEDDTSDERLGEDEEDNEDDVSANRKRRQKRREVQKAAKERSQRELAMLRQQNADLLRRVSAVEGHVVNANTQSLDQRLAQAQREVEMAEQVIAKATKAGNGDDVVAAMRIRDAATQSAHQLAYAKQQFEQSAQPQADPKVVGYAQQWIAANPWYDPNGRDNDSKLTKAIDNELVRDGFNPSTREYWEELTARVADAFGETAKPAAKGGSATSKKTPPPTGGTREHAPQRTKNEIYVTPERKQAMIDAGAWDDPVKRQSMLKAYQAYDHTNSAR